ncbi:MAG: hypothetical protein HY965_02795 [Ignavibacteriales bacterium]|nr:hypothetical protein [Ignavibacteriales bacterium]
MSHSGYPQIAEHYAFSSVFIPGIKTDRVYKEDKNCRVSSFDKPNSLKLVNVRTTVSESVSFSFFSWQQLPETVT